MEEISYNLLRILIEYVKPSEREEALFAALDTMVDEDVDLEKIKTYAQDDEEELMTKCITKYIKENYGDEDEEEEW